jgi:hypothetical protein
MQVSKQKYLKLIFIFICFFMSVNCPAQSKKFLSTDEQMKSYISNDAVSVRMGKGVVAWIYTISDGFDYASQHYFSCDGRFLSDSFSAVSSSALGNKEREVELLKLIKQKQSPITYSAEIEQYESSELVLKNRIRPFLKEVCANASRESKDLLFPFFTSAKNKGNIFSIASLVSGTFNRKGDLVEGWIRRHEVLSKEHRLPNGEIFYFKDGSPMMTSEVKDKSYQMNRFSVNCKDEKVALLAMAEYDSYGQLKPSASIDPTKPIYEFPVPKTLGAFIVTIFCTIY